jgi:hypothetical protein
VGSSAGVDDPAAHESVSSRYGHYCWYSRMLTAGQEVPYVNIIEDIIFSIGTVI